MLFIYFCLLLLVNASPVKNSIGSKRKFDEMESTSAANQTDEMECGICLKKIANEDASKACTGSDKHNAHKECLAE